MGVVGGPDISGLEDCGGHDVPPYLCQPDIVRVHGNAISQLSGTQEVCLRAACRRLNNSIRTAKLAHPCMFEGGRSCWRKGW